MPAEAKVPVYVISLDRGGQGRAHTTELQSER